MEKDDRMRSIPLFAAQAHGASEGGSWQSKHCHKERTRVVLWDVASSANITDAINSSLASLKKMYGEILVAKHQNNKPLLFY